MNSETRAGLLLIGMTALALVLANSPAAPLYDAAVAASLHVINDDLMAVFFLLVALEIKRELKGDPAAAALPAVAALFGMAVPAAVYLMIAPDHPRGWAIPAATDIAFSLGVLSLLKAPVALRVFLAALAIIDDLGAVLVIALYYAGAPSPLHLAGAALAAAGLAAFNRAGVRALWPYLAVGVALWAAMLGSGLHPTLAGVVTGLAVPAGRPLERLEHALSPWVAFAIVPVFALANAGVPLAGLGLDTLAEPVLLGVAAGLFLGKQAGVLLGAWVMVRFGLARLPAGCGWRQLHGAALLAGVGFTMSLFIAALAFPAEDSVPARLGILAGSLLSALAGALVLVFSKKPA